MDLNLKSIQISKIYSLHYKALRQIFKIKSPYFHRVLLPSDSPCSNEYVLSLSYPVLSTCIPSSLRISDSRIKCLGHILRHPSSPASIIMFNPSFSLQTISSPFRRGAPRAHWPELSLAEASHRHTALNTSAPLLGQFHHEFYRFSLLSDSRIFWLLVWNSGMILLEFWGFFYRWQKIGEQWVLLTPKMK